MRNYKPLRLLTTIATISIALQAGIEILAVFLTPILQTVAASTAIDENPLLSIAYILIGSVTVLGLMVLNAALFLSWIYRAAANLPALGRTALQFTPGAAVLWWFVPFANFFKPYQAVKEIVQASDPDVPVESEYGSDWISGVVPPVVGVWWTLWVGRLFYSRAISTTDNMTLLWVEALVTVAAAATCIVVMRIVSERQEALAVKVDLTSNMGHVTTYGRARE